MSLKGAGLEFTHTGKPGSAWRIDPELFDPLHSGHPTLDVAKDKVDAGTFFRLRIENALYSGTQTAAEIELVFFVPKAGSDPVLLVSGRWHDGALVTVDLKPTAGPLKLEEWISGAKSLAGRFPHRWGGKVMGPVAAITLDWSVKKGATLELLARAPLADAAHRSLLPVETPWTDAWWLFRILHPADGEATPEYVARMGPDGGGDSANGVEDVIVCVPRPAPVDAPHAAPLPSLMSDVPDRRSAILARGDGAWSLQPGLPAGGRPWGQEEKTRDQWWSFPDIGCVGKFDYAIIEGGYDIHEDRTRQAIQLQKLKDATTLKFQPGGTLRDANSAGGERSLQLPLTRVIYRAAADQEGDHVALVGEVDPTDSIFAAMDRCVVELTGRPPDAGSGIRHSFEFISLLDRVSHFTCLLKWRRVHLVCEDLIVRQSNGHQSDPGGPLDLIYAEVNDSGAEQGQLRVYLPQEVPQLPGKLPNGEHPDRPLTRKTEGRADVRVLMPSVQVERAANLMLLHYDFENLDLVASTDSQPRLVRHAVAQSSFWRIGFPPQHLAEEGVDIADQKPGETTALFDDSDKKRRMFCRIGGESRLCFLLRKGENLIPLGTPQDYLDWNSTRFEPSVQAVESLITPAAPGDWETSIEIPFKLKLTPDIDAGWAHQYLLCKTAGQGHELWHTRLAARTPQGGVDPTIGVGRAVRAAWTGDFDTAGNPLPPRRVFGSAPDGWDTVEHFHSSLVPHDRRDIVTLTYKGTRLIDVEMMMLTALAGSLTSLYRGVAGSGFESWQHRATLGRDHFVKVVRAGILFPYGLRAAYIRISERKFIQNSDGTHSVAYLTIRRFIEVRDRDATYTNRNFPASRCAIQTAQSPNLQEPDDPTIFWPTKLDGTAVQWPLQLQDHASAGHGTHQALLFVANKLDESDVLQHDLGLVNQVFMRAPTPDRTVPMFGSRVAFAENERPQEPVAAAGDGPAAGDPAAAKAPATEPSSDNSKTSYDTHEMEIGASVDRGIAAASLVANDINDVLGLAAEAAKAADATIISAWKGFQEYLDGLKGDLHDKFEELTKSLNEIWDKTKGDIEAFRKKLGTPDFNKLVATARQQAADFFNLLAADFTTFQTRIRSLAESNVNSSAMRLYKYLSQSGQIAAGAGNPIEKVRRLVQVALPDVVSKLEEVTAIFGAKVSAVELRDVRSVVQDLGIAADAITDFIRDRLGPTVGDLLKQFNGLNAQAIADSLANAIRELARRTRLELYQAFEQAKIEIPPHIRRLREHLTDTAESFEALNRKLLEFWAGIRFKTMQTFAAALRDVRSKHPANLLRELLGVVWTEELLKQLTTEVEAGLANWTDALEQKFSALWDATQIEVKADELRRWLIMKVLAAEVLEEKAARVPPQLIAKVQDLIGSVPVITEAAERDIVDKVKAALKGLDISADAIRVMFLAIYLESIDADIRKGKQPTFTPATVEQLVNAVRRARINIPGPIQAVAELIISDALADKVRVAKTIAREVFGAVLEDDFRGLLDKLVPAADELARYVTGKISTETKKVVSAIEREVEKGREVANRLSDDLNLLLSDVQLFARSVNTLVARAIDELKTEWKELAAVAESEWTRIVAEGKDALARLTEWRQKLEKKVKELTGFQDGLANPDIGRRVSTRVIALLRDFDQVILLAGSSPVAERLERLNRLLLRMRFPRSIPDPKTFVPTLRKALVSNPAVAALTGAVGDVRQTIEYAEQFVQHGFDKVKNAGELFCKLTSDAEKAAKNVEAAAGKVVDQLKNLNNLPARAQELVNSAKTAIEKKAKELKEDIRQALQLGDLERQMEDILRDARGKVNEAVGAVEGAGREVLQQARDFFDNSELLGEVRQIGGRVAAAFPAAKLSGLALPDMDVSGLSRKLGNVAGDLEQLAREQLDPFKYFPSAKILGKLDLKEVVKAAIGGAKIPAFVTDYKLPKLPDLQSIKPRLPEAITNTLDWKPEVQELAFFKPLGNPNDTLNLHAETVTTVRTRATTYKVEAQLKDFAVVIGSFIEVQFKSCTFTSGSGSGSHCDPKVSQVIFKGPLAFVEELQKKLGDIFGGGFKIEIVPTSINISLALALPDLTFGVFSMTGLRLATGLSLPLRPNEGISFHFRFADRGNPFTLAVAIFGGTGFFAIELQTGDKSGPGSCVKRIEAALEFGGYLALNLGVASGSVAVMGGVYYSWQKTAVEFSAYLRITGHLCVLGFVSVTVEFLLSLSYVRSGEGNYAEGTAQLTIRIKIGFFSKSFHLSVHRRIAGSGGSGSMNGADSPQIEGCRSIGELEAAAENAFDRNMAKVSDEMSPEHFAAYWGAFA